MKKVRKIIFYFLGILFSLIVLLIVVAALSENRIARLAIDQVAKTTKIPIEVETIEFSLLRNFPNATIQCNNIWIAEAEKPDTLVYAGKLFVSVEVKPLLKSIFKIRKVEVDNAIVNYTTDTAGVSNIDFLMATDEQEVIDTSANAIFLDVSDLALRNVNVRFRDDQLKAGAHLLIEQLDLKGLINGEKYEGTLQGKTLIDQLAYGPANLNRMEQSTVSFNAGYQEGVVEVKYAEIKVDNAASFVLKGSFSLGDSLFVNMNTHVEKLDLKATQKYLPDNFISEAEIRNLSGNLQAKASIQGIVSDSMLPEIDVDFILTNGRLQYKNFPAIRNLVCEGKASNGAQHNLVSSQIQFKELAFQTDSSRLSLNGSIHNLERPHYNFNTKLDIRLEEVSPFLPDSLFAAMGGRIKADLSTKGAVPDSVSEAYLAKVLNNSNLELRFSDVVAAKDSILALNRLNGQLRYEPGRVEINQLQSFIPAYDFSIQNFTATIWGDVLKIDSLEAAIDTLKASKGKSSIDLTGNIREPKQPVYALSGNLDLDFEDIAPYLPADLIKAISGKLKAQLTSSGTFSPDSIEAQLFALVFENSRLALDFDDLNAEMTDSILSVNNLSGNIAYANDSLWIDYLSAGYREMSLALEKVSISNLYRIFLQKEPAELIVNGNFSVDQFDYALINSLMAEDTSAAEMTPGSSGKPLNFSYQINGNLRANSVKYEDAVFRNVASRFLVKENYYVLDSLRLDAFNGRALSSVKIEMQPDDRMVMFFKTDMDNMDTRQLMKSFGQYLDYEEIRADNVMGQVSTQMDGEIVLKDFEPVYESLMLKGDLTIENGALFNVKPVVEVEKIPGIGLKNMDSLYFSTLNSSLFLFNNDLYIPRTEIRSTSFDAMFLGMYSFGGDYAYHIRMFLGEVLSSKSKSNLRKQAQEGGFSDEDEKDVTRGRTSIYLVSKSENGKEKAGFDKKHDRANMAAKVNLQKQMVDMRFHPTLVKYDTYK